MDLTSNPFRRVGITKKKPSPQAGDRTRATIPSHLLRGARRRPALFILVSAAVIGALYLAVDHKVKASYRAESLLHVNPVDPRVLYTDDEWHKKSFVGFYDDYVRTLSRRARSLDVLSAACDELQKQGKSWADENVPESQRPHHLRARLVVNRVRDTHLVSISLEDKDARIPADVVNVVAQALLSDIEKERHRSESRTLEILVVQKRVMEKNLTQIYDELDTLSAKLGSALLDERQNIFYERIQVLEEGLTKIFVRRVEAEGALASAKARAEQLVTRLPEGQVESELDLDTRIRDARVMIARRLRELDDKLMGKGPNHPARSHLLARRAELKKELAGVESRVRSEIEARLAKMRSEEAANIKSVAENDLEAVRRAEKSMKAVLQSAKSDLEEYGRAMFTGSRLRSEARRLLQEIERVDQRATAIKTERAAAPRVDVREFAVLPEKPVSDRSKPLKAASALVGLIAGLLSSAVVEFLASRSRQRGA